MKPTIRQKMQVWSIVDGVKTITTVESGPDALNWLVAEQQRGAEKVGYTPIHEEDDDVG